MNLACIYSRGSALSLLIDAGSPLNVHNVWGNTALILAADNGAFDCVALLLARGRDALELDATNGLGRSALHLVARNSPPIVRLLLEAGANPTIRNNTGRTPLDLTRTHPNQTSIALLEAAVVEPDRTHALLNARTLIYAAYDQDRGVRRSACLEPKQNALAVAPTYLKRRVQQGQELPRVTVQDEKEKVTACIKYALGLEGGGGVVVEGAEPQVGMPREAFVELCEMLVPKWALKDM